MDIIVSYAFAHIVEAIILWMSMSQMYDQRYKQWVTGMVIMAGHTVMFGIFLIGNIYVVTVVNIIVYMILIYKLYNINKRSVVFWAIIFIAIMALSEQIVFFMIQYIVGISNVKQEELSIIIAVVSLCKIVYFIIVETMVIIRNRSKIIDSNDGSVILLMSTLIASLLVFMTYYIIETEWSLGRKETVWIMISSVLLVLSDIFVLWVNIRINERNVENARIKVMLEQEKADARYYRLEYEKNESLEILRHDMNNHLNTMLDMGNDKNIKQYIIAIMDEYKLGRRTTFSNNNVLNGLVLQYVNQCKDHGIDIIVDIRPGTVDKISPTDIVALFGNILSNAFEAVMLCVEYNMKFIELVVKRKNNAILIICRNTCHKSPKLHNGKMMTTKKDSHRKHGYGMKSIEKVVNKYNGSFVNRYDDEKREFSISIILMNT